jgi:hypothetical protein
LSSFPSISDAFEKVVQSTSDAIAANAAINWGTLPKKVYFMHGHPKEIVNVLQSYTNSPAKKNQKYPLVALLRDIKENVNQQQYGLGSKFNCSFLILGLTVPTYRSTDREVKNFKLILHPILSELLLQISLSSDFGCPTIEEMNIVKWDRYFWGTQAVDKNILNDYVDAVEVENISLNLINNICP